MRSAERKEGSVMSCGGWRWLRLLSLGQEWRGGSSRSGTRTSEEMEGESQ